MPEDKIIAISSQNLKTYPDVICFINPKHKSYPSKLDWIKNRLSEGLRIKLLFVDDQKKAAGFIEYIPGEEAWRAVSAKGFMFIHCIYVYPNKNKRKGMGSRLIRECLKDAKESGLKGAAVIVSEKAFMAGRDLFIKNGFISTEIDDAGNELLVKSFKKGTMPRFNDWSKQLSAYKGLHLVFTRQCPWVARFVDEVRKSTFAKRLNLKITEMKTAAQAQKAPSLYATLNLIHNGKLLTDRYISMTRFKNILTKEKLI